MIIILDTAAEELQLYITFDWDEMEPSNVHRINNNNNKTNYYYNSNSELLEGRGSLRQ